MRHKFTILICLITLGCGMFAKSGVPKELIDADLAEKVVDVQEGPQKDWFFKDDATRCFDLSNEETKITDTTADITIIVASWQDLSSSRKYTLTPPYLTVFGRILLKYTKNNGKWELQSVEPKDLITKGLEKDQFKKWLEVQTSLCRYSIFTNQGRIGR